MQTAKSLNGHLLKRIGAVILLTAASAIAADVAAAPRALDCPHVTLVSPYPPGGGTDTFARLLAPGMTEQLGVTVIVLNKPGANGNIGTEFVGRANPDGCTLLLANAANVVINRNLYKLRLDPLHSLQPVAQVASVPLILYVNPTRLDVTTPQELISVLRANPGKYSFASGGAGTPHHLAGERLKHDAGVDILHVPYTGQGPAMANTVAGHTSMAFETTTVAMPYLKAGMVRPLATTAPHRLASLPDLPTMVESGFDDFIIMSWYAVFAPAGVPKAVIQILHGAVLHALAKPEVAESMKTMEAIQTTSTIEEVRQFVDAEAARWAELVTKTGVRLD